jgi:hypothetical protein
MKDLKQKVEMIKSIQNLQLSDNLIQQLDDAHNAQYIVEAVHSLETLTKHWN